MKNTITILLFTLTSMASYKEDFSEKKQPGLVLMHIKT
jgi:hypothetical protein